MPWQRVEKTEFGYAVQVPPGWVEREADLRNSPWETARFVDPADRRHSVIVFRNPVSPQRAALDVAEQARTALAAGGFVELEIADTELGGQAGARLDCAKRDAGRVWSVREYFAVTDGVSFCLGCGSAVLHEDESLFAEMARTFEFLPA
jgi:hypothetical protein